MKKVFLILIACSISIYAQSYNSTNTGQHIDSVIARANTKITAAGAWAGNVVDTNKTSAKVYSIDGSKGSVVTKLTTSTTVNFTSGMSSATMQSLIDAQPKNLNGYTLTFQFADGTYTLSAGLTFYAFNNGAVVVSGNTGEALTLHSNQAAIINMTVGSSGLKVFHFNGISAVVNIRFLAINITDGAYTSTSNLYFYNCPFAIINGNLLTHTTTEGFGILFYRSCGSAAGNYFTKGAQAIRADYGSLIGAGINSSLTSNPTTSYYSGIASSISPYSTTIPAAGSLIFGNDAGGSSYLQNMIVITAPSTASAGSVTNRYGGATNFLGDPVKWFTIVDPVTGTAYKVPAY